MIDLCLGPNASLLTGWLDVLKTTAGGSSAAQNAVGTKVYDLTLPSNEFQRDGSTHLVNQEQYDAVKPFAVPPVSLDPVSNLLAKVLGGVGASKPSRDAFDRTLEWVKTTWLSGTKPRDRRTGA